MRRYVLALALFGAATLVTADEPKKDAKALTKKDIGKLMKATHHGDKSAHARTVAELKKDAPDWEQLAKDAKAFAAMSDAFKGVRLDYSSPEKYIESTKSFTKATGAKDKKAANEAFTGLTKSCASCHSYGGVGGAIK
jgi:hypothetical protein